MSAEELEAASAEEQKEMEDKVTTKMKSKQLPTAAPEKTEVTGDHIPTPQDLPQRKPSPGASKLAS
uniref:Uncharacterized protein n=1 Tax=Piliocolobus tephrosceles TaxID=591936 RepID=A0A8C9GHQ7_9PRIM